MPNRSSAPIAAEPLASSRTAPVPGEAPDVAPAAVGAPADAVRAFLDARLDRRAPAAHWGIGVGETRTVAAARAAEAVERARRERGVLALATGDPRADALLAELAPVLVALVDELTDRQAEIARAILVDGVRQAQVAHDLGVSRASISVAVARANVGVIRHAVAAITTVLEGAGSGGEAVVVAVSAPA